MAHYHFTLVQRLPEHRIMLSYMETIESLMWAVSQLGHDVSFGINQVMPSARNVISNLGLLTLDEVMALPKGSIFLNLEQRLIKPGPDYRNPDNHGNDVDQRVRWQRLLYTIDHHSFWDYSRANLLLIQSLQPKMPHFHVPIGWAPTLEKVNHAKQKDFDVIFFGSMSDNRQAFFDACIRGTSPRKGMAPHRGLALTNLFGSVRDELLGRSKIASHAPKQQHVPEIFGIVRCAHLMANRIPFVAQTHLDMHPELIGSDVLERVKFCTTEAAYDAVNGLLDEPHAYAQYCDSLYDCIRQRDLVATVKRVL